MPALPLFGHLGRIGPVGTPAWTVMPNSPRRRPLWMAVTFRPCEPAWTALRLSLACDLAAISTVDGHHIVDQLLHQRDALSWAKLVRT